ncbi:MAG: hypothetical protein LBN21_05545, partial [Treponema sp.]|nr:hypothetical protein [Treponema sp.]
MKKILGVLLLLAAAGVLFAQEFKWNGYVNSGLGLVATDKNGVDNYLTAYGNDSWQYGYRLRLDGAYTNADANAGANFRIQSQATRDAFISIPYAYGWVKFLGDGVFTLKGGLVDDGTWNSGGAILGSTDPDTRE